MGIWNRFRACLIRIIDRPFGVVVTINDLTNIIYGVFFLFSIGHTPETMLYQSISSSTGSIIWPILIILTSVVSQYGLWKHNTLLFSWASMLSSLCWLFALFLYIQTGAFWAGVAYVIRPVAISAYAKLKARLDKEWYTA